MGAKKSYIRLEKDKAEDGRLRGTAVGIVRKFCKLGRKAKEVGLKNVIVGGMKYIQYRKLRQKYPFDSWHLSPYEWREYAQACVRYVNAHNTGTVVDIGCGLGGVLQHIKADKRIGLDVSEAVIMAAREIHNGSIRFEVGSFRELSENPIDFLITLNFMHGRAEEEWSEIYHTIALNHDIRHFIVDTVPAKADDEDVRCLDWNKILPNHYKRIERFGSFLGGRFVEVWEKQ